MLYANAPVLAQLLVLGLSNRFIVSSVYDIP